MKLQGNVEFYQNKCHPRKGNEELYQNKCHPRNAPDTRRLCAKATDMWAQWVASRPNSLVGRPHFVASH
jgi:hypothetical protein